MSKQIRIDKVMSAVPTTISIGESVRTAKAMMEMYEIRHLPVVDGSEVIGIVSERDVLSALSVLGETSPDDTPIEEVCTFEKFMVEPSDELHKVLSEMAKRHVGSALIVSSGSLLGIFTSTDACRLWGKQLRGEDINQL